MTKTLGNYHVPPNHCNVPPVYPKQFVILNIIVRGLLGEELKAKALPEENLKR